MDRWTQRKLPEYLRELVSGNYESWGSEDADPDDRLVYLRGIEVAWLVLGLAAGLLMVFCAYVADGLAGHGARNAVLVVGTGAVFFCESGVIAVFYHSLHGYLARYWQRHAAPVRAARAARRATPRNSSLIWQAAVGVLAAFIVAAHD